MIALITVTTFILLARAFRSLLLPAKAIILNVLSVAAAWGVLVLVWQHGYGSELIWDIEATGSIPSWMPLMIFAFLFGLSMDYEVFILARMREEYDRTGSTETAVIQGIGRTGRLVTSAALILFLVVRRDGVEPRDGPEDVRDRPRRRDPARRDDHPGADRARRDHADGPLELVAPELAGARPAGRAVTATPGRIEGVAPSTRARATPRRARPPLFRGRTPRLYPLDYLVGGLRHKADAVIGRIAATQHGAVARHQLIAAGLTARMIDAQAARTVIALDTVANLRELP